MSVEIVQRFIEGLRGLEESKEVEPLATLYAKEAVIGNVIAPEKFQGQDGARQFWTEYRGTFERAASTFRNVIATEERAALEWVTEGTSAEGKAFIYSGVTILEIDGERITRSTAYFDPQALGRQIQD